MITVTNTTRNTTLASHVKMARFFWQRLSGLMGKPSLPADSGLWITPCPQIHSCFMRFVFDAVFVDKHHVVVGLMPNMPPWRLSPYFKGAKAVLELPAGVIAHSQTQLGDQLHVSP